MYTEGQEMIIETTLTANHAGHIDIFICPNGSVRTFVEDMIHGGPVDENYPS